MTEEQTTQVTQAQNDKEFNFRRQEQMYQRMLEEKEARIAEMQAQMQAKQQPEEEEQDDEPYVDHKKLNKKLAKFGEQSKRQTQTDIQKAINEALKQERREAWLRQNSDFYEVMKHADKFASHDPELAETILDMPEGFERQKLVYKNIKALGLHQDKPKESIQQKVDANRRSPYYQPSSVAAAPYAGAGDFSPSGQKNAYQKLQELKSRLRLS